jgi:FtsP/CotA-like multicopper oxidase with cupredoxin domain
LSRRAFLRGSAAMGGVLLLGGRPLAAMAAPPAPPPPGLAAAGLFAAPASEFAEPEVRRSIHGLLRTRLRVAYARNQIGADRVYLRCYEGALTGPTLRLRAGDTLELELLNQLPAAAAAPVEGPAGLNVTNLHTHGLHVSPAGSSDNVLLEIPPGAAQRYHIEIPRDHPAGTFWYHAHRHGSTAVQLGSGMSGALIVEGDGERAPSLRAAAERLLVFQQIPYSAKGTVEWKDVNFEDFERYTTVNGRLKPRLLMRPGEVQRWRLLHAGIKELLYLSLVDSRQVAQTVFEIAHDGLATGRRTALTTVEMGPGYRTDLLVQLPRPGSYYLLKQEQPAGTAGTAGRSQVLAEVLVSGPPQAMRLPGEAELRPLAMSTLEHVAAPGRQALQLSIDHARYMVNGQAYDHHAPPHRLKLGAVDEWTVSTGPGASFLHSFHIHVNPFQVIALNGRRLDPPVWRDTVLVAGKDHPYPVKEVVFRTRYRTFTGRFVLHCHNAVHEDLGMMQQLEIVA